MLDDMFSFIDPIMESTEENLFHFITQVDEFLTYYESLGEKPLPVARPLSEETYKQMWMLRYQQYMGQMTFLELLDKYEEILGISPRSELEQ